MFLNCHNDKNWLQGSSAAQHLSLTGQKPKIEKSVDNVEILRTNCHWWIQSGFRWRIESVPSVQRSQKAVFSPAISWSVAESLWICREEGRRLLPITGCSGSSPSGWGCSGSSSCGCCGSGSSPSGCGRSGSFPSGCGCSGSSPFSCGCSGSSPCCCGCSGSSPCGCGCSGWGCSGGQLSSVLPPAAAASSVLSSHVSFSSGKLGSCWSRTLPHVWELSPGLWSAAFWLLPLPSAASTDLFGVRSLLAALMMSAWSCLWESTGSLSCSGAGFSGTSLKGFAPPVLSLWSTYILEGKEEG